jgi:hypothetical protein
LFVFCLFCFIISSALSSDFSSTYSMYVKFLRDFCFLVFLWLSSLKVLIMVFLKFSSASYIISISLKSFPQTLFFHFGGFSQICDIRLFIFKDNAAQCSLIVYVYWLTGRIHCRVVGVYLYFCWGTWNGRFFVGIFSWTIKLLQRRILPSSCPEDITVVLVFFFLRTN